MAPPPAVTLHAARREDASLLANLLELYVHDLSALFPHVALGPDGRFGYGKLPLYFAEPDRHFAFVLRCDGKPAGFAFATRGSPAVEDPETLDVAEFFVLRSHRRSGVGAQAAYLLFGALPGKWTVRVLRANAGALEFWSRVVAELTQGTAAELEPPGLGAWQVFSFATGRPATGA